LSAGSGENSRDDCVVVVETDIRLTVSLWLLEDTALSACVEDREVSLRIM
jgi:hypothetical protein